MNFFKRILKNQSGVSLPLVIILTGVALSSIGYVALDLLPKLQDSKKKAESIVDYRIFLGSLNDYIVHGVREKWCFPVLGTSGDKVLSNLLLSNDCASTVPMETKVKFAGNLERILWGSDTIGETSNRSTILGLNDLRFQANQTTVTLDKDQVNPPVDSDTNYPTLKFRVTDQILTDMNDSHPLFAISKDVKNCIEFVDIEIARTNGGTNPSQGDEVKLRVSIKVDLHDLKPSCFSVKTAESVTYYTFYPRRLHTFSLIKYGTLDSSLYHEYNSPVYVAGNLLLPPSVQGKAKSSIFYDTLTLGTYNNGLVGPANYYAGIIKDGADDYTFEDRGNPYTSKQDNYPTMRGFLGGIRLDATEDKGFVSLFDWDNNNQSNVETLERCIDENKIKTTPSASSGTILAYSSYSKDPSTDTIRYKLGFNKLNRFKPTIFAPAVGPDSDQKFIIEVPATTGQIKSIGEIEFKADPDNTYSSTIGAGSSVNIKFDLAKFDITPTIIDGMVTALNLPTTASTYQNIVPPSHVFSTRLNETQDYKDAADDLIQKCATKADATNCLIVGITGTCENGCDVQSKLDAFVASRDALIDKINAVKLQITAGEPQMTLSLEDFQNGSDIIINQKYFQAAFTPQWKFFFELLKDTFSEPTLQFTGYNYGPDVLKIQMFVKSNNVLKLKNQEDNNDMNFSSNGWRKTFDNDLINNIPDEPKELVEINCPTGMGLADWDLDMSASSNFAWNYTDNSPGISVDTSDHANKGKITFDNGNNQIGYRSSTSEVLTVSVADECEVENTRTHIYGFYVCKKLTINAGRSLPLNMIGTFIVKTINNLETNQPVYWHSIWSPIARDLVLTDLNHATATCTPDLASKTMLDVVSDPILKSKIQACSSQDLINNGPNNFTWTTVDPNIGIAPAFPTMTSEKVKRFQRWIVREDSRKDDIR